MADEKSEMQELAEKLYVKKEHSSKSWDDEDIDAFATQYKEFLSENKTEREVIEAARQAAEAAGFKNIRDVTKVENGGQYYRIDAHKNLALIRFAGLGRIHAIASHADSPCLHLKPYPLQESQKLALFKGHYYGGIKRYQWMNIPLALHGVAHTQSGKKVEFTLGEREDEPCFAIPDLLPHLADDQLEKKAKDAVMGEQLNPIVGSLPVDDENVSDKVKLAVAKHLNDEYGLVEEDLVSAELIFVPAGPARNVGFDEHLISGYGHDDRVCVYTSLRALLDAADADQTQMAIFFDKEEIGSFGKTGAKNLFLTSLIEELIELSNSDVRPSQVWSRTNIVSADVTSAVDPNFSDVHDTSNACYIGYGVAVEKFTGGRGKYHTNDADAEYAHRIVTLLRDAKVPWQSGENGKLDIGGGGTIAMYLAQHGADVIDMGVPVLGMHAPYELVSKSDVYSLYEAYKAFTETVL